MSSRITHIGVVVHDLDAAIQLWDQFYGFQLTHRADIEAEGLHSAMLSPTGSKGEMAVELMQPMNKADMGNAVARHLARAGEGFYHLAMTVDDVEAAGPALQASGARVYRLPPATVGEGLLGLVKPGANRLVVHPKSSNGILVELMQSGS